MLLILPCLGMVVTCTYMTQLGTDFQVVYSAIYSQSVFEAFWSSCMAILQVGGEKFI